MTVVEGFQTLSTDELQQRAGRLHGQPFAGARMSYGDELHLRFGSSAPGSPRSGWTLGTRTSRWILLGALGVLARDTDGPERVDAFAAIGEAKVAAVDATRSDRTLVIAFDTGHRFVLLPNKPHRSRDDLDLWELFSPYGWWLAIRRDGVSELIPDDMPPADRRKRRAA